MLPRLLQRFPAYAPGWLKLGLALLRAGQVDAALVSFHRAIAADPSLSAAQFHRGNALYALGRHVEACAAFERAEQLAPTSHEIPYNRGLAHRAGGDLAEARLALERSVVVDSSFGPGWFALGLVCQDLHDPVAAVAAFRAALREDPMSVEATFNLGIALQETGAMDAALESYAQCFRLRPDVFGRIAQAVTAGPTGVLWLDLDGLRHRLGG